MVFNTLAFPTPEYFHQLRTGLKRILFIRNLMSTFYKKSAAETFRPYKKIFKSAGVIRESHIHAVKVKQLGKPNAGELGEKEDIYFIDEKAWRVKVYKFIRSTVPAYAAILKLLNKWSISEEQMTQTLYGRVYTKFSGKLTDVELHKSRKLLKELLYFCEISPSSYNWVKERLDIPKIILLEDAIGDWHDLEVIIDKAADNYPDKILSRLKREKARERKKISTLSRQMLARS